MSNKTAIFICGSGGSGKSTITNEYFSDYKIVDVDIAYEKLLIEHKLGLNIRSFTKTQNEISSILFEQAKVLTDTIFTNIVLNGENVVINSVGRNVNTLLSERNFLEKNGYVTYMIMLYADLDVCIKRVELRDRSYHKNVTIASWYESYSHIVEYKKEFNDRFLLINTEDDCIFNWKTKFEIFISKGNSKKTII